METVIYIEWADLSNLEYPGDLYSSSIRFEMNAWNEINLVRNVWYLPAEFL